MRNSRRFALASIIPLGCIAACTYDFDPFEGSASPTDGGSTADGGDGAAADVTAPPRDSGVADAPATGDASGGCSAKASCYSTATSCNSACDATHSTCTGNCGGGQPGQNCRAKCDDERKVCKDSCASSCRNCAGPACESGCP